MGWDKTRCPEGGLAPDLNDDIRANAEDLEAALTKEMNFSTGGTASLQGILKQGSARCFIQDTAPATRIDGSAFASTDLGMLWIDTNSSPVNQFNLLTAITPTWTPVSTEVIAVLLASARTFAKIITFDKAPILSKAPTLTEGIVANNSYLQARNAAGDGNADMVKVDASGKSSLPDGAVLAAATEAEDGNRTIADKAFVGAQIAANHPAYTGGESHTDGSGLIMKMGNKAISADSAVTVTFAASFPNGIVSVVCTLQSTSTNVATPGELWVTAKSKTAFSVLNSTPLSGSFNWIAIGR